ncbi:hypothetical protein RPMA_18455 [Tardiphaga alba]|uniref:Uncharacterized protein n=1 Tax=Tardiphaga alba TaxID=340268 RepID=A0ABX8AAJ9_9BRAD|nr:hypothetical protein [Tardiphaga alba]QUS40599.1 hypothetical protein RPMA_18455 [Tardiphaga alba]
MTAQDSALVNFWQNNRHLAPAQRIRAFDAAALEAANKNNMPHADALFLAQQAAVAEIVAGR